MFGKFQNLNSQLKNRLKRLSVLFFILFQIWTPNTPSFAQTDPLTVDHAEAGVGTLFIPQRNTWGFLLDAKIGLQVNTSSFCKSYHCQVLDLKLRFSAADTPFERYVPYVEMGLTAFQFQLKPWLSFGLGSLHYFRSPKRMDTESKLTVSLAQVEMGLTRKKSWVHGYFAISVKAFGYTDWRPFGFSVPFYGLHFISLNPYLRVRFGSAKTGVDLFASLFSGLSVGTSGDNAPDVQGGFGSLFSESWFEFGTRFSTKLPGNSISFFVQAHARYHILVNSGNKTLLEGIFVGITTGISLP